MFTFQAKKHVAPIEFTSYFRHKCTPAKVTAGFLLSQLNGRPAGAERQPSGGHGAHQHAEDAAADVLRGARASATARHIHAQGTNSHQTIFFHVSDMNSLGVETHLY